MATKALESRLKAAEEALRVQARGASLEELIFRSYGMEPPPRITYAKGEEPTVEELILATIQGVRENSP